jgi:hypothetical protein
VISNAGGMDLASPDSDSRLDSLSSDLMLFSKDHTAQAAQHRLSLDSRSWVFKICAGYQKFLPAEGFDLQLMHDRSLNFYRLFFKILRREIVF